MKVSQWYELGNKGVCGDPLGLCRTQKFYKVLGDESSIYTQMGWQNVQKTIPSGHFCTVTTENEDPNNFYFYWVNHTELNDVSNQYVVMETVEQFDVL